MFENRRWVILTTEEADNIVFSQVLQDSADTLSWNEEESKTFVKYDGNKPSFLSGKTTFTHSQILAELAKDEWMGDPPE